MRDIKALQLQPPQRKGGLLDVSKTFYRPVFCLARSAAISADLELDALLLLRGAIAVRDKNNTATIFECGAV